MGFLVCSVGLRFFDEFNICSVQNLKLARLCASFPARDSESLPSTTWFELSLVLKIPSLVFSFQVDGQISDDSDVEDISSSPVVEDKASESEPVVAAAAVPIAAPRPKPRRIPIELQRLFARLQGLDAHATSTERLTDRCNVFDQPFSVLDYFSTQFRLGWRWSCCCPARCF